MAFMDDLADILRARCEREGVSVAVAGGEITVEIAAAASAGLPDILRILRDDENLHFEQLMDIAGMDYSTHSAYTARVSADEKGARFAAVYHFLSLRHNHRARVRAFCADDDFPALQSAVALWPAADWFEREAFDLFGIVFHGHPDLRRILTDYGFVGHPFRKDFPISGYVEMRYDPEKRRVIYVPVSIPPREVTPRITREESFARGRDS